MEFLYSSPHEVIKLEKRAGGDSDENNSGKEGLIPVAMKDYESLFTKD